MQIRQLGEYVGGQIDDLDLTEPMDDASFAQVLAAFHRHSAPAACRIRR